MASHKHVLESFVDRIFSTSPASVLDVGCGNGQLIGLLKKRGVNAAGLDSDPQHETSAVHIGDAENMPFSSNSFDVVVSTHSLHHFSDPRAFLAESTRVARRFIFVLDQWYDAAISTQRVAQELSRWYKTIEQRNGIIHNFDFGTNDCLHLVQTLGIDIKMTIDTQLTIYPVPSEELEQNISAFRSEYDTTSQDLQALDRIRAKIDSDGISREGTIIFQADIRTLHSESALKLAIVEKKKVERKKEHLND